MVDGQRQDVQPKLPKENLQCLVFNIGAENALWPKQIIMFYKKTLKDMVRVVAAALAKVAGVKMISSKLFINNLSL